MKTVKLAFYQLLLILVVIALITPQIVAIANTQSQTDSIIKRAKDTLSRLTPEEKVGQLFLVTFQGDDVAEGSIINTLITRYHVGGVVLKASNDNFTEEPNVIDHTYQLIKNLQTVEYLNSEHERINLATGEQYTPAYIPLFIGIFQEGDGYPNDQILSGVTQLPSQMAIGATWNPSLAKEVGKIQGQELSALGFNLLLGPSLDVVEDPRPMEQSDLGARTFGGDPYWVSQMAEAYVAGVHEGSENRMAVIATHFPGLGNSDRLPILEVATVRKSLEQLKQIELAPFFAVTGNASSETSRVDGLLTSHIRYQGFQGNIRATTKPISFDPQAFGLVMSLLQFSSWRENYGLMISDDLGNQAVKNFFTATGQDFVPRRPVLDAFLAGNDLLYTGTLTDMNEPDNNGLLTEDGTEIFSILEFFAQKYREDPAFAERVNQSVLRILILKYRLYEFFTLSQIIPAEEALLEIGKSTGKVFDVAQQAATLINPSIEDLNELLPSPPGMADSILIFTDTYLIKQCSTCEERWAISKDALKESILRLYGPGAGGQVSPFNITTYTFQDLLAVLENTSIGQIVTNKIIGATWVIFVMQDVTPSRPESQALQRLLAEKQDLLRRKNVIVFAANAPYYLDATDISKLTAYYGLYSKGQPFLDIAARLLFREIPSPTGASPVSVTGIGYDLRTATSPDPSKIFKLVIDDQSKESESSPSETPNSTEVPNYDFGSVITVSTTPILDYNGHPVPDQTPVQFILRHGELEEILGISETKNGIATIEFELRYPEELSIVAFSNTAISEPLLVRVENIIQTPTTTAPTLTPTSTITPTVVPSPEQPTATPAQSASAPAFPNSIAGWIIATTLSALAGYIFYSAGQYNGYVRDGVRWGLVAFNGGLFIYVLLSVFPNVFNLLGINTPWSVVIASTLGAIIFGGAAVIWTFAFGVKN